MSLERNPWGMLKSLYSEPRRVLTQQALNAVMLAHERSLAYQHGAARAELARTKLDRLNLANRNLAEADFSFASLVGAILFGTNLERANLHCADLRDSDLSSAHLTRTDLRGASICGARLAYAKLDGADLRAATVAYRGPGAALAAEGRSVTVDFSNASLRGASFGNAKLDGVDFSGALLQGANFKNAQLSNVSFRNAVLTGANLSGHDLPPEALEGCVLDVTPAAAARAATLQAMLDVHELCVASGAARGTQGVLDGEDLRPLCDRLAGRKLTGLSLRRANAIGADFSYSQLQGARFDGADLRECDFSHADLRGASFKDARLAHARFDKANFGSLTLPDGAVLAPDLSGAEATREQFFGALLEGPLAALGLTAKAA
ncbi:MAG: pentapeptide repeat-containing protein [Rhizomicrobium sp.]